MAALKVAIFIYFRFMQSHDVSFEFKARYFTVGDLNTSTKAIWIVLHGYGQLAGYFIKKFEILKDNNIYVVAPEALSRFYVDPLQSTGRASDRVGATWMTKENRLADIDNYLAFLNKLYAQLELPGNIPITILGFSQGAATASRWISDGSVRFNRLILWAGLLPPDLNFGTASSPLKDKEVLFVYGRTDPFLDDTRFHSMEEISAKLGIKPNVIAFDGGHEIPQKELQKLI